MGLGLVLGNRESNPNSTLTLTLTLTKNLEIKKFCIRFLENIFCMSFLRNDEKVLGSHVSPLLSPVKTEVRNESSVETCESY